MCAHIKKMMRSAVLLPARQPPALKCISRRFWALSPLRGDK